MGTETPGGQRPSITVTNIGNAIFTVDTWHMCVPITFTTSGPRTYYLEITGTRPTEFFVAGNYKASATFTCT